MEKLLKVKQVAELLQVSKRTVYDWTHVEYIPHYRFPNGLRFRKDQIERWLKMKSKKGRARYQEDDLKHIDKHKH